jgi:DNA-binding response OmpR family regulator
MRSGLRRMLGAFGYAAETFASAELYLACMSKENFDCMVVDINLGGLSGIELCRRLTASGQRIPTIFITARDDESTRHEAAAVGYVAYLNKPFAGQILVDAIELASP